MNNKDAKKGGPLEKPRISISQITTFMVCPRLEWYRYHAGDGYGVEPRVKEEYFIEGELAHYALAMWYKTGAKSGNPLMLRQNMVKRVDDLIGDQPLKPEQARALRVKLSKMIGACLGYKAVYRSDFETYRVTFVEEEFELDMGSWVFVGKLDLGLTRNDGKMGFFDHKFEASISTDTYSVLPLNIQGLGYCLGFKALTGQSPAWYSFNYVLKSALRQRQGESLLQLEQRIQEQYVQEKARMFFRTPPLRVEKVVLDNQTQELLSVVEEMTYSWSNTTAGMGRMNQSSCKGKYGKACRFAPACSAYLLGDETGWDAATCKGLFQPKSQPHTELSKKGGKDDKKADANKQSAPRRRSDKSA